ncbi:MAG: IclR family transcriptional regulator [Actinomycetota bacterium]|nr:IclR family transcriptional regulator [Actinomycetota bacterium]
MADQGSKSDRRSTGSRTLARGLSLLQALGEHSEGATVSTLADATDLDRAVLYRLLETLTDEGFVTRDPETRRYRLGLAMLELGVRAAQGLEVRRLAGPPLRSLMEDTGETACLAVRDRGDMVVVEVVEPPDRFVQVNYRVGFRHELGVAAHGRALLAFLPEGARDPTLAPVRQGGVAFTRNELEQGASGVAAPVFDHTGKAVAGVGIVAPSSRLPKPESAALRVLRTAREISERLGWRPRRQGPGAPGPGPEGSGGPRAT